VFGSWYADCRNEPFEGGVASPDFKVLAYVTFLRELMGPSEDLAAVEKKTSEFDLEAINVFLLGAGSKSSLGDAAFQLLVTWATSMVSSVIATAVAALFRVAAIFARWAVCGVMKLSTNYTHRAQFTV